MSPTSAPASAPNNPEYFKNPDLLSQLKFSTFEGSKLNTFLRSYFDKDNVVIKDDSRRHSLVNLLKTLFKNINERGVVRELNTIKDNSQALSDFLNKLAEFVTYHANFSSTSEAVLQFQPSSLLLHVNKMALTGAITTMTFGSILAMRSAAVRGAATGAGLIGGAAYLAVDALMTDTNAEVKLLQHARTLISHFSLSEKIPAMVLNSLFLPFITEASVSRVTCKEMQDFVESKGRKHYDKIVNKSVILKHVLSSASSQIKDIYFEQMGKVIAKIQAGRHTTFTNGAMFAGELNMYMKEQVMPTIKPETEVDNIISAPAPAPATPATLGSNISAYNSNMPLHFSTMIEVSKKQALNATIPKDYETLFDFSRTAELTPGTPAIPATLASIDDIKGIHTDLSGNSYFVINLPDTRSAEMLAQVKTAVDEYLKHRGIDVSENIQTLGFTTRGSDVFVPVVVSNLLTGNQVRSVAPGTSYSALRGRVDLENLNAGTFEYYFNNPAERILLKLAGLEIVNDTDLNHHGNIPTDDWPKNLGSVPDSLTALANALKSKVESHLNTPGSLNTIVLYRLLSELLKTAITPRTNVAQLAALFRTLNGAMTISEMVQHCLKHNLALLNDAYKRDKSVQKGPIELFSKLKDQDRHMAAKLAYAMRFPVSRRILTPGLIKFDYDDFVSYFNNLKARFESVKNATSVFNDYLSEVDMLRMRNVISNKNLNPKTPPKSAEVAKGEYIISTQLTINDLVRDTSVNLPTLHPNAPAPAPATAQLYLHKNTENDPVTHGITASTPPNMANAFAVFTSN
jgi:hypothetical protein